MYFEEKNENLESVFHNLYYYLRSILKLSLKIGTVIGCFELISISHTIERPRGRFTLFPDLAWGVRRQSKKLFFFSACILMYTLRSRKKSYPIAYRPKENSI